MRRHHLLMLAPVLVAAAYVGWITAAPGTIPTPVVVAVLIGGPSLFLGAVLEHRWRACRRVARSRSLFGP
ncbi:hypothetical protein [Nonomuraea typhae]|uniref:hypothetical protein n=1 Tax=Nonomuraea typhae TaxID=2603600 RepID=UPI0012FC1EF9|nr:hypothetical protein [Nonomuraea typhae]